MQAPPRGQGLGDQHEVFQAVVHANAVLVDHPEAGLDVAEVALPQQVLAVLLLFGFVVLVGVREDRGPYSVFVDFSPGLEGILVNEAYVAFVQEGVFGLEGGKW